jgi:hypothetical protein
MNDALDRALNDGTFDAHVAQIEREFAEAKRVKAPPPGECKIVCPHCGGTTKFRYLEDIVCHRDVIGFDDDGIFHIEGLSESGEGYDDGSNARLECREDPDGKWCGHEFPLPDWFGEVDIEWD